MEQIIKNFLMSYFKIFLVTCEFIVCGVLNNTPLSFISLTTFKAHLFWLCSLNETLAIKNQNVFRFHFREDRTIVLMSGSNKLGLLFFCCNYQKPKPFQGCYLPIKVFLPFMTGQRMFWVTFNPPKSTVA